MWGFLGTVIEHAGFIAGLYVLTLIGVGYGARALWKRILDLNKQLTEAVAQVEIARREEHVKRSEMREAFERERAAAQVERDKELLALAEQRRREAESFGRRLDEVRDNHTTQMVTLVEKSTRHVERTDQTVGRLGAAVDTLIRMSDGSSR